MATIDIRIEEIVPDRLKEETSEWVTEIEQNVQSGNYKIVPDSHKEETTEWVTQVEQRYKNGNYKIRQSSTDVCIFKVPPSIRYFNRKAYDADVVHLGPFFRSQDNKRADVDDHKLSAVEATLLRSKVKGMENLINIVMKFDNEIRDCYQDRAVECTEKTLAWMMTMDACFIIRFICSSYPEDEFNLFFQMRGGYDIATDILKLENQIPLLVLKQILQRDSDVNAVSEFAFNVSRFWKFGGYPFSMELEKKEKRTKQYIRNGQASHLLDLCRMLIKDFLIGSLSDSNSDSAFASASAKRGPYLFTEIIHKLSCICRFTTSDIEQNDNDHLFSYENSPLPTAEKLTTAGIKFEQSIDGKIGFKTRSWGSATLSLPRITVYDRTETLLRNLMVLEECRSCVRPEDTRIICYYISLLDKLIDSKEDVALLKKGNIIQSWLGSDQEVADMFNALSKGIRLERYPPYDEVLRRVREHHDNMLHRWIAEFKKRYCSKPWLTVSVVVGLLILSMTAVQTSFSVKNR